MKKKYEMPVLYCEIFAANKMIANSCSATDATMTCLAGNDTDTTNVFVDSNCKIVVGTTSLTSYQYNSNSTVSAGSNAYGLMYVCIADGGGTSGSVNPVGYTTSYWSESSDGVLKHSGDAASHLTSADGYVSLSSGSSSAGTGHGPSGSSVSRWHCQIGVLASSPLAQS